MVNTHMRISATVQIQHNDMWQCIICHAHTQSASDVFKACLMAREFFLYIFLFFAIFFLLLLSLKAAGGLKETFFKNLIGHYKQRNQDLAMHLHLAILSKEKWLFWSSLKNKLKHRDLCF